VSAPSSLTAADGIVDSGDHIHDPKGRPMKSLLSSKPVLLFLFLFNAAVAVAVGIGGDHIHIQGHPLHGSQLVMTCAGMGIVALGAGIGLLRRRLA
jgi:hypothetical protein